jgi:hypothetical protein
MSQVVIEMMQAAASAVVATAQQSATEIQAGRLVAMEPMRRQIDETTRRLMADPAAVTVDGKSTVARAVNEFAFLAALGAANGDPAHPKIIWAFPPPHTVAGRDVPGSRWGIDNPDHVYRFIPIDGASSYELVLRPTRPLPTQFSVLLYQSFLGEDGKEEVLDTPIAGQRDRDLKPEIDGSYRITIDSTPANGRINHIQSDASARILWIRNTLANWDQQGPMPATIRRIGGPAPSKPPSESALAERAAVILKAASEAILRMKNGELHGPLAGFSNKGHSNVVMKPILRGGAWGFMAPGNFKLADDEALLVTVDPLGAQYLGFQLSDAWTLSLDVRYLSSMNGRHAHPNPDGSYTYVISIRDPGVLNWLDTGGLLEGLILIRWQVLPEGIKSLDGAVREVKLVRFADLGSVLPASMPRVTWVERKRQVDERVDTYARRYSAAHSSERRAKGKAEGDID